MMIMFQLEAIMKKSMTIIYPEYNGLYINLTNRCPCNCTFCIRQGKRNEFDNIETLWLEREPTAEEVISAIKEESQKPEFKDYKEFVFCGYGEPTEALEVLLKVADFLKANYSLPVRINTNGLGDLVNQKSISPLFKDRIDVISISLNSSNPEIYEKTVRPVYKEKAFPALLNFVKEASAFVPKIILSTVDTTISHEDEAECQKICDNLGVTYRIREYTPFN